jgi:hypothetical protein
MEMAFFREPSNRLLYTAAGLMKRVALLYRSFRLRWVYVEGTVQGIAQGAAQDSPAGLGPGERSDFAFHYIGEGESVEYLKRRYLSKVKKEERRILPLWELQGKIRQLRDAGTLLFVETNRLLNFALPAGGHLTYPWIRQRAYLNGQTYRERQKKIEETYGRKVRQHHYRYKTTRDEDAVLRFYNELYVPYTKGKHGDIAHLRRIEDLRAAARSGFLLQVFDGDTWVSGAICRRKRKEISAFAFGLIPEYDHHLQRGALSAVYYFLFQWAQKNAIKTVDLLRSRPHACDGVYEHKRRWGARAEKDLWPHTAIWIYAPRESGIPPILKRHLIRRGKEFIGLSALSNPSERPL